MRPSTEKEGNLRGNKCSSCIWTGCAKGGSESAGFWKGLRQRILKVRWPKALRLANIPGSIRPFPGYHIEDFKVEVLSIPGLKPTTTEKKQERCLYTIKMSYPQTMQRGSIWNVSSLRVSAVEASQRCRLLLQDSSASE